MVHMQLERRGITDPRVLDAMRRVKRHHFVEPAFRDRAYEDSPLPIEEGQTISQPYIVGRMTSLLKIQPTDRVLEIGTGSGYQAAVLAELADKVYTIERHMALMRKARANLEEQGYRNVVVKSGDGTIGWQQFAPFDKIIVTASSPVFPKTLFNQLKEGGLLVMPMGEKHNQKLVLIERVNGEAIMNEVGQVTFVPLIGKEGWKANDSSDSISMSGRGAVR
ncbi:protein-L-isoaspartate(D-aspartate) O-methyltransferase [bacterium]|nr:protein-L-isoaspartate(D-aspartate) O-methyltransferase [bacterium]MBU1638354.1 protein-L-isoaspartate(D-aspartate) O-methyltransferase [bacterium]MBU1919676.1 protein-L-isoaspartate(D-aspartate) O-methyltransferase [bacterium]